MSIKEYIIGAGVGIMTGAGIIYCITKSHYESKIKAQEIIINSLHEENLKLSTKNNYEKTNSDFFDELIKKEKSITEKLQDLIKDDSINLKIK
ncbi:MAG: hypothetical protein QW484_00950 [Candidatus Pacearchaeota archaeon]